MSEIKEKPAGTKRLTLLAVFVSISLAVYIVESALPPIVPIPGVKLGLANIITLVVIKRMSVRDAGIVLLLRIILGTVLTGQGVSFIYSLSGGVLSLLIMGAVNSFLRGRAVFITSIFGALSHNLGQVLAAFFVLRLSGVLFYIPYLCISGCITGLFTGLVVYFTDKYLPEKHFLA